MNYIEIIENTLTKWWTKFLKLTPNIAVALLVFFVFYTFSHYFSKILLKVIHKISPKTRQQRTADTLLSILKYLFIFVGAFWALEILGLGTVLMTLLGSLGVVGIIAGVALKDLVSSIFSGVMVGVDHAFRVGDYVTINNVSGTVQEIGFITTKIITDDGRKTFVPNQLIFTSPFVNFTASQHRRVILDLEFPDTEDLQKIKDITAEVVKGLTLTDLQDQTTVRVSKQNLGVYNMEVRFWIQPGGDTVKAKSEALLMLKNRYDKEGIATSVPQSINIQAGPASGSDGPESKDK